MIRITLPDGSIQEQPEGISILADGTLEEVRVLKSSGHKALDRAALATVRQAAPYQPSISLFRVNHCWPVFKPASPSMMELPRKPPLAQPFLSK